MPSGRAICSTASAGSPTRRLMTRRWVMAFLSPEQLQKLADELAVAHPSGPSEVSGMDGRDKDLLHYAVGLLCGLHDRFGDYNIVIYHDRIRVQVQLLDRTMVAGDLGGGHAAQE